MSHRTSGQGGDEGGAPDAFDLLDPVLGHHIVNTLSSHTLRPLQTEAVAPLIAGEDAVLLASTAGGKTEAAIFPVLTRMNRRGWKSTSVLYVCPLKALLNNLPPRLETYAGWLGRSTDLWHGDVTTSRRRRLLVERPDILLTTPESLESMLVSTPSAPSSAACAPSSSTRSTPSPGTIAAGTCWPSSNAWHASRTVPSSASACPRPSATPPSCWTGSRAPGTDDGPAASSSPTHGCCLHRQQPHSRPERSNSTTSAPSPTAPPSSPLFTAARNASSSARAGAPSRSWASSRTCAASQPSSRTPHCPWTNAGGPKQRSRRDETV